MPLGAWTLAIVFDLTSQVSTLIPREAGDAAVAIGVIAALATVITGYTDFHVSFGQERRVAMLHGLLMTLVTIAYGVSALLRWRGGPHDLAVWIAVVSYVVLILTAYLGGHLVFQKGTMVNRNAFTVGPSDFKPAGLSIDFAEGQMRRVMVDDAAVLLVRLQGKLCAIGAVCSHASGPLDEGKLEGTRVTCPWHGSRFDVCSGKVMGGPATIAQPVYDVQETDGNVQVRQLTPIPD